MSNGALRLGDYLTHILQAIERVYTYCADMDEVGFLANPMAQDAIIRNFEVIGEASKNIERVAPQFVVEHPELPIAFAYDMRNILAHGYYKVDLSVVWRTIERDLPYLKEQVENALKDM